jgi:hypothetical protein
VAQAKIVKYVARNVSNTLPSVTNVSFPITFERLFIGPGFGTKGISRNVTYTLSVTSSNLDTAVTHAPCLAHPSR